MNFCWWNCPQKCGTSETQLQVVEEYRKETLCACYHTWGWGGTRDCIWGSCKKPVADVQWLSKPSWDSQNLIWNKQGKLHVAWRQSSFFGGSTTKLLIGLRLHSKAIFHQHLVTCQCLKSSEEWNSRWKHSAVIKLCLAKVHLLQLCTQLLYYKIHVWPEIWGGGTVLWYETLLTSNCIHSEG